MDILNVSKKNFLHFVILLTYRALAFYSICCSTYPGPAVKNYCSMIMVEGRGLSNTLNKGFIKGLSFEDETRLDLPRSIKSANFVFAINIGSMKMTCRRKSSLRSKVSDFI